jgi:hypothetical protein
MACRTLLVFVVSNERGLKTACTDLQELCGNQDICVIRVSRQGPELTKPFVSPVLMLLESARRP